MPAIPRAALVMIAALVVGGAAIAHPEVASAGAFLPCHDDSSLAIHNGQWTHGSPNTGLTGDVNGGNGYYYLDITAGCGQPAGSVVTITGTVHLTGVVRGKIDANGMCWRLDISPDYNHAVRLVESMPMGTTVTISYTKAIVGHHYRLRVANLEVGTVITDHASFDG